MITIMSLKVALLYGVVMLRYPDSRLGKFSRVLAFRSRLRPNSRFPIPGFFLLSRIINMEYVLAKSLTYWITI